VHNAYARREANASYATAVTGHLIPTKPRISVEHVESQRACASLESGERKRREKGEREGTARIARARIKFFPRQSARYPRYASNATVTVKQRLTLQRLPASSADLNFSSILHRTAPRVSVTASIIKNRKKRDPP